jgi:hypothetical protein
MRIAPKLALLALSICAVMAFGASAASAVTVAHEANNVTCGTVTESGVVTPEFNTTGEACPLKGNAVDLEFGGAFGAMAVCDLALEGFVSGTGVLRGTYTLSQCVTSGGVQGEGGVPVGVCTGAGDRHISGQLNETSGTILFCDVVSGLTTRCGSLAFTVTEVAHVHSMVFNHANKCANGVNSLQGTITQVVDAAHPKVEVKDL